MDKKELLAHAKQIKQMIEKDINIFLSNPFTYDVPIITSIEIINLATIPLQLLHDIHLYCEKNELDAWIDIGEDSIFLEFMEKEVIK